MAKALKIKDLSLPQTNLPEFFDDWVMDIALPLKQKVIVAMHVKTRMGIAAFPPDIGGISGFFGFFPFILNHHLYNCGLQNYTKLCGEIDAFWGTEKANYNFTKTKNLSVNAHMNQFKYILDADAYRYGNGVVDQRTCDYTSKRWLKWLIRIPPVHKEYISPSELWEVEYNGESSSSSGKIIPFII